MTRPALALAFAFPFLRLTPQAISILFFLFARVRGRLSITMKPHPTPHRIRKTIKWGGAAVTVLLVMAWIGSGWGRVNYRTPHWGVGVVYGTVGITHLSTKGQWGELEGWEGLWFGPPQWWWTFRHDTLASAEDITVPLWSFVAATLAATCLAWRLDALARRRARQGLNLCPKCHYDRTGLPGGSGAVCPECGTAA